MKSATLFAVALLASCSNGHDEGSVLFELDSVGTNAQTPHLARSANGSVYLSWVEEEGATHRLLFAKLEADGWSSPLAIAEGSKWFVNWADRSKIAALDDGTLIAHWLEKTAEGKYDYSIQFSLSRDDGATWSDARMLHDDERPAEHGFVSFAARGDRFAAIWLDGRRTKEAGGMTLYHREITADGELLPETLLDELVCDCCPTALVPRSDGSLWAAYRDRSMEENRNITVLSIDGTRRTAHAVQDSDWTIAGCPVNGPGLAIADDDRTNVIWFNGDPARVYFRDLESSGPSTRFDLGSPLGRVVATTEADGTLVIVWLERTGEKTAEWMLGRWRRNELLETIVLAETTPARAGGHATITRGKDGLVVAWTDVEDGWIKTRLIP